MFSVSWLDMFSGGYITTRLTVPPDQAAQLSSEATALLGFTTREALQQALDERSARRLRLNPAG